MASKESAAAAANNLCLLNLFKFNQTRSILWKVSGSKDKGGDEGKGEAAEWEVASSLTEGWHNLTATGRAEQSTDGVGLLHVQFMCNALPMLLFCCCYLHSHAPSQHHGHKLLIVCLILEYIRQGVAALSLCLYLPCVLSIRLCVLLGD